MNNQEAIGLIDSGVDGLTTLKEALRQLPNERLICLGDTTRCPYGPRPIKQVVQFFWETADFLLRKRIKMLVVTYSAATAVASEEVKTALSIPVVGAISPGTRAAVKVTENNKIGAIGTSGTIKSVSYEIAIRSKAPTTEVTSLDCPRFVPIIEGSQYRSPVARKIVAETPQALQLKGLNTSTLGCIHYPLLRPTIQNVVGSHMVLIDLGVEIVGEVSMLLGYFDIVHTPEAPIQPHEFYTTGSVKMFGGITSSWLGIESSET